jgi:hypothetical protein
VEKHPFLIALVFCFCVCCSLPSRTAFTTKAGVSGQRWFVANKLT